MAEIFDYTENEEVSPRGEEEQTSEADLEEQSSESSASEVIEPQIEEEVSPRGENIEDVSPRGENENQISIDKDDLLKILMDNAENKENEDILTEEEIKTPELESDEQSSEGYNSESQISVPDYSNTLENIDSGIKGIKEQTTELMSITQTSSDMDLSTNISDIGLTNTLLVVLIICMMFDLVFHFLKNIW